MTDEPEKLLDLLSLLREAINTAQVSLEARGHAFNLSEVEVEAKVTASREGKAGIVFHLVTLGAEAKGEEVHTIKLKVVPTEAFKHIAEGEKPSAAPRPPGAPGQKTE
jgi:hypothetical protein